MQPSRRCASLGLFLVLGGCAMQSANAPIAIEAPRQWDNGAAAIADAAADESWWEMLRDPVIDRLVASALADNPTLGEALARVDQARATLDAGQAARLPRADISGAVTYGQQNLGTTGGANAVSTTVATVSPGISWEIDLWGRVRETARAAQSRLGARTADARAARLSVAAEISSGVLRLRACNYSLGTRDRDIASRTKELDLMRVRLDFGNIAPVDVATAEGNLASAKTDRIAQLEECNREINALVAVTGTDGNEIRALLPGPSKQSSDGDALLPSGIDSQSVSIIPAAPPMRAVIPATVLLHHPGVVAAEAEATARWAEIGVARAERMPRLDLAALLTGQWLRALGTSSSFTTWSLGPQASATIFDGGAGAANVRGAEARYREAVAALEGAVRTAVRGVEDGLAAQQSAEERKSTSSEAVTAASFALTANEVRWRAGAISQFELEEARRQYNAAMERSIGAARDDALAWVELVRATGNGFALSAGAPESDPPSLSGAHPLGGQGE